MNLPATFSPFDPHQRVEIYHRHLPHWRQKGATYFVTFRLSDSVPLSVVSVWRDERRRWLQAHGITDTDSDQERVEKYRKISLQVRRKFERRAGRLLHIELDRSHGCCLLKKEANARLLWSALTHFHGDRCWMGDFVIMPNHVHALVLPFDLYPLEKLLCSIKSYAARRFEGRDPLKGTVFQAESYDRIVRNHDELRAYRKYIEANGEKAGLSAEQYWHHRCDWL